jgi:hypothetical protein
MKVKEGYDVGGSRRETGRGEGRNAISWFSVSIQLV